MGITNKGDKPEKGNNITKHIVLYIIETIVLVLVVVGAIFIRKATKVEKVNLNEENIEINETSTPYPSADKKDSVMPSKEEEVDKEKISKELYEKYNGKFNIAFFGVDSRDGELGAGTRSDSMIICCIDMETHEVKLVSIYRDTYLNIGNDTYNKCNAAYAKGGPERALSMININTDLYIDQYITVGFEGLVDAIDALGGVPIDVKEDEIFHLNNYQLSMAEALGKEYIPVVVPGTQMLNGVQATAYCRIRYAKGSDFKRAERQRDVITAMLKRTKTVSLSSLTAAVTAIFPNVQTSLSINDVISMMSVAADYEVTLSDGFPFEGMRNGANISSCGNCVVPTSLTKNVKKLHELLFDEADYEPSDAVKKYSAIIEENTNGLLMY